MIIDTTFHLQNYLVEKINRAAKQKGISRTELIIFLIKKVMDNTPEHVHYGRRIKYQSRYNHDAWRTFHTRLRQNDYECILDLRKLFKMSASLILTCAIKEYLDELIEAAIDNYHYTNYLIIKETIDGIQSWRLIWGFPRNLELFLP